MLVKKERLLFRLPIFFNLMWFAITRSEEKFIYLAVVFKDEFTASNQV
ncbi:hypothetical protein SPACI_039850 [Sporomusa acidovorans DSM 3132]|uniref:Uncharacterized protein n=1 Tax=Sporomusa acidovorans (strain ATCC 49682 / DSM 3132 / Mol) TaxID=1123286 RepID=A0ABZ3J660_SPOA4|nr:hypothetical protein SPACI_33630 [Sporomusa acidovorans DSM 3132]SDE36666.1 hypothetical protein SAMN04488499_101233 [Sporomusa acidovorans]